MREQGAALPPADGGSGMRRTRELIGRLFSEGTVVARSDGSVHGLFPVSVSEAEGEALREWVKRERAAHTLEIGLGYGISALFVCEGLVANGHANARHVVLDPNQSSRFADCGLQLVAEAGLAELVEFHAEASEIALPRFLAEGRQFDLAFVDGNHRFDGVFLDLIYLGRLVRAGGIVVIDDHQLPAVARATSFCTTNLGWTIEDVSREEDPSSLGRSPDGARPARAALRPLRRLLVQDRKHADGEHVAVRSVTLLHPGEGNCQSAGPSSPSCFLDSRRADQLAR